MTIIDSEGTFDCCTDASDDVCYPGRHLPYIMDSLHQMEANMVETIARLTISSSERSRNLHDVSFSLEDLTQSTSENVEAEAEVQTPTASIDVDSLRRSLPRCHKRSSSFLATPVQSQCDFYFPTPVISNTDRGHSCKKMRTNDDGVISHIPMLPDSPLLDECNMPVIHRPCFSPFLRSSAAFNCGESRLDYKSVETSSGMVETTKVVADTRWECPSLAPSRTSSPLLESLPYLDANSPSFDHAPCVRILKMRKEFVPTIPPRNELFNQIATTEI
jgi:hypothetical protein